MDSTSSIGTLTGHKAGVNCIEFGNQEQEHLYSGGDDFQVIIWNLQTRSIVKIFQNHTENITCLSFISQMTILSSVSEDGNIVLYNTNTYEEPMVIQNFIEKGWTLDSKEGLLVGGFDQGCVVLHIGSENAIFDTQNGKLFCIKNQ